MEEEYKIVIDYDHPAGEVVFVVPSWASKDKPANADVCHVWTHAQLSKSGLKDGDKFMIDTNTGKIVSEVPQLEELLASVLAEYGATDVAVRALTRIVGEHAVEFLDGIRDYEDEAGKRIAGDERTSKELYQIFLNEQQ